MAGTLGVKDDIANLRSMVAELIPDFQTRAGETERLRTMPADLVERAKAAGLFRLNLPRSLGGYELDPAATVEIFEEISRADGSVPCPQRPGTHAPGQGFGAGVASAPAGDA